MSPVSLQVQMVPSAEWRPHVKDTTDQMSHVKGPNM